MEILDWRCQRGANLQWKRSHTQLNLELVPFSPLFVPSHTHLEHLSLKSAQFAVNEEQRQRHLKWS